MIAGLELNGRCNIVLQLKIIWRLELLYCRCIEHWRWLALRSARSHPCCNCLRHRRQLHHWLSGSLIILCGLDRERGLPYGYRQLTILLEEMRARSWKLTGRR